MKTRDELRQLMLDSTLLPDFERYSALKKEVKIKKEKVFHIHRTSYSVLKLFVCYNLNKVGIKKFEIKDKENGESITYEGNIRNRCLIRALHHYHSEMNGAYIRRTSKIQNRDFVDSLKAAGGLYEVVADKVLEIGIHSFAVWDRYGREADEFSFENYEEKHSFASRINFDREDETKVIINQGSGMFAVENDEHNRAYLIRWTNVNTNRNMFVFSEDVDSGTVRHSKDDNAEYISEEGYAYFKKMMEAQKDKLKTAIFKYEYLDNFLTEYLMLNQLV